MSTPTRTGDAPAPTGPLSTIDYSERIPNNVDLASDRRLQRALESWQPKVLDWWKQLGPALPTKDVYLRTAIAVGRDGHGAEVAGLHPDPGRPHQPVGQRVDGAEDPFLPRPDRVVVDGQPAQGDPEQPETEMDVGVGEASGPEPASVAHRSAPGPLAAHGPAPGSIRACRPVPFL